GADAIDARLHAERLDRNRPQAPLDELPDGAFALVDGAPHLVLDGRLERWTPAGYAGARLPARGRASTITPPSLVELLRTGWSPLVPFIHPTAGRRGPRPRRRSRRGRCRAARCRRARRSPCSC